MSYISPVECGDNLTLLAILKKLLKQDTDGNFYSGVHGLTSDCDVFEDGADDWKICCGVDGEFEVYYKDTITWSAEL